MSRYVLFGVALLASIYIVADITLHAAHILL